MSCLAAPVTPRQRRSIQRNCARTPMQWSTEPNAGFTKSDKPVLPVISDGPYSFQHVNVADQRRDPNSLLNWMERIIRMRKEVTEIGRATFLSFRRELQRFWQCSMTGATTLSYASTTLAASRVRCGSQWTPKNKNVCSPISCPAITANPTPAVGTACCSNLTAVVGSACAAWWITYSNAPPSNPDNEVSRTSDSHPPDHIGDWNA